MLLFKHTTLVQLRKLLWGYNDNSAQRDSVATAAAQWQLGFPVSTTYQSPFCTARMTFTSALAEVHCSR